ncbi:hypothetical protein KSP39_PZI009832 [Platanthera zijinensis]|uniref:Uncharacterized protein n=1 Tax=Platanthera zijinensis TaxID=2320716 RepID=A0AAP0G6W5_9ASPA
MSFGIKFLKLRVPSVQHRLPFPPVGLLALHPKPCRPHPVTLSHRLSLPVTLSISGHFPPPSPLTALPPKIISLLPVKAFSPHTLFLPPTRATLAPPLSEIPHISNSP